MRGLNVFLKDLLKTLCHERPRAKHHALLFTSDT